MNAHRMSSLALMMGLSLWTGSAMAADALAPDSTVSDGQVEGVEAGDGLAWVDVDEQAQEAADELPLAQRYVPPPPRRYYRPYRPGWSFRVVPPPVFAPGWLGLYLWGYPPPPPTAAPVPEERVEARRKPEFRHVGEYSLGLSAGSYTGTYSVGGISAYSDPGLRMTLNYRSSPVVGGELAVGLYGSQMRLDGQGEAVRQDVPVSLSATLNAFPRSPIQPYLVVGATTDLRTYAYRDSSGAFGDPYTEVRVGPHLGLGLELLIGDNVSATMEGRKVMYTLVDRRVEGQTGMSDAMFTGGLKFYF